MQRTQRPLQVLQLEMRNLLDAVSVTMTNDVVDAPDVTSVAAFVSYDGLSPQSVGPLDDESDQFRVTITKTNSNGSTSEREATISLSDDNGLEFGFKDINPNEGSDHENPDHDNSDDENLDDEASEDVTESLVNADEVVNYEIVDSEVTFRIDPTTGVITADGQIETETFVVRTTSSDGSTTDFPVTIEPVDDPEEPNSTDDDITPTSNVDDPIETIGELPSEEEPLPPIPLDPVVVDDTTPPNNDDDPIETIGELPSEEEPSPAIPAEPAIPSEPVVVTVAGRTISSNVFSPKPEPPTPSPSPVDSLPPTSPPTATLPAIRPPAVPQSAPVTPSAPVTSPASTTSPSSASAPTAAVPPRTAVPPPAADPQSVLRSPRTYSPIKPPPAAVTSSPRPAIGTGNTGNRSTADASDDSQLSPSIVIPTPTFDSTRFDGSMGQLRSEMEQGQQVEVTFVGKFAVALSSVSVGAIFWMIRAGSLGASFLTTVPVWSFFDTLPVLKTQILDDEDEESLESIIDDGEREDEV